VGLEHTRWLGPTVRDIAREKLAVVREGSTLVIGSDLHPDAEAEARRSPAARLVHAAADAGVPVAARGAFQRRNFALAATAAEQFLGRIDPDALRAAGAEVLVPGRLQEVDDAPLTLLDGAHNPGGVAALAAALPEIVAGRRLAVAVSILDDKDAGGMLAELLPACDALVVTSTSNPRALPPATLASLAGQLGGPPAEIVTEPQRALVRARELAGPDGVALATGSIYLVADLLRPAGTARASVL
jgi:dihydrofolate synthase/folylpolyglutamate synthase